MNDFDHNMINQYLDGEMDTEETRVFETLMKEDNELQKEVELYRDVKQTLKRKLHPGEDESALRKSLNEMRGEYFSTKPKIVPFSRKRWVALAAAVFIGLIMFAVWAPWKKDLYQQYAYIQMPGIAERGTPVDSLLKKATEYFNSKKFTESIPVFEKIAQEDPQNSYVQYFFSIALLQDGQTERSRIQLTTIYNGISLFRFDAAFYIALGYLKEKNKPECSIWLNKIPADSRLFDKAQELLKKL